MMSLDVDFFIVPGDGPVLEADKRGSNLLSMKIHNEFSDIFPGISCFEGTFKLQVRRDSHQYQALPSRVANDLQEPL